jgi:hypothetical protein
MSLHSGKRSASRTRRSKLEWEVMTRSFTRASELYVLIGHESALPRVFLIVYTFLYVLPQGILVLIVLSPRVL